MIFNPMIKIGFYLLLAISFISCTDTGGKKDESDQELPGEKQLNINILIDLSDRLSTDKYPEIMPTIVERDKQNIEHLVKLFIQDARDKKAFKAKGKFKVWFDPTPKIETVNNLASMLQVDFRDLDVKAKKEHVDSMQHRFSNALKGIYEATLNEYRKPKDFPGSNVWGFVKERGKNLIIEGYDNYLFVFTDGYLFYGPNARKESNGTTYIGDKLLDGWNLENKDEWKLLVDNDESIGLIPAVKNLNGLKIVFVEISQGKQAVALKGKRHEVVKYLLENWVKRMNTTAQFIKSDLPVNTQQQLNAILGNN